MMVCIEGLVSRGFLSFFNSLFFYDLALQVLETLALSPLVIRDIKIQESFLDESML